MIATERFIFLHLHKSGGTFVNECLMQFLPDARTLGYHLPRRMIPPELAHLPVLGFVRNPWSYYVSWYTFQAARHQPNALFKVLSNNGRLDFEATIRNMLELGTSDEYLDALLALLPREYGNRGLNLTAGAVAPIRNSGLGFYSYLYRYLYGGDRGEIYIGRMEELRTELRRLLLAVRQPVSDAMRNFIMNEQRRNVSQHTAYAGYYSDALRRLVAERDAEVIARHDYRFEGG